MRASGEPPCAGLLATYYRCFHGDRVFIQPGLNPDQGRAEAGPSAPPVSSRYGYSLYQGLVMWSLSLPQVAATLAAALVAFEAADAQGQRLINEPVLNSVIVLLVVTSILGPILTEQFGNRLATGPITALATSNKVTVGTA